MTEPTVTERDREMALSICRCLSDGCDDVGGFCGCAKETAVVIARVRAEADAAGYARGKAEMRERAVGVAWNSISDPREAQRVAAAIRALED